MSSPRSEEASDISITSQWQSILNLPEEISQRLSGDEDFGVVLHNLNNSNVEEYEQALQEFTSTVEKKNLHLRAYSL